MSMPGIFRTVLVPTYLDAASRILRLLPPRWAFTALVLAPLVQIRGVRLLALHYRPVARKLLSGNLNFRFSTKITQRYGKRAAQILYLMGAVCEADEVRASLGLAHSSPGEALSLARTLFELAQFERALRALEVLAPWDGPYELAHLKALLGLILGNEQGASRLLLIAAAGNPDLLRAHQNLSARTGGPYTPNELDIEAGVSGRLYDAYNYAGERVTHVGAGHLGAKLYGGALRAQRTLRKDWPAWPEVPTDVRSVLSGFDIALDELRLLPQEWVSQIGHLGLMDVQLRMRDLGWWRGSALVVAQRAKVANSPVLSLFEPRCRIFLDDDTKLLDKLSSLQRYTGLSFNAFELPSGDVVPWSEAGALMLRQWEGERRRYPLRDEYDSRYGSDDRILATAETAMKAWGMGPRDWYVCLHLRDAAHYGEMTGIGQSHRNTGAENYLPLIEHVTRRGGFVIKLGGPHSLKLPKAERLIDYARSSFKSEALDLYLIRRARYFVGTTSGLTNLAICLGVPSALVNCITVDAQLWGDRVRFAPKLVMTREGHVLTQRQITSSPWRWRLFGAEVMLRYGLIPQDNSPDEILETVKEVEQLANQVDAHPAGCPHASGDSEDPDGVIERWRGCLGLPHFYGNARPSLYFLHRHRVQFLQDFGEADRSQRT